MYTVPGKVCAHTVVIGASFTPAVIKSLHTMHEVSFSASNRDVAIKT